MAALGGMAGLSACELPSPAWRGPGAPPFSSSSSSSSSSAAAASAWAADRDLASGLSAAYVHRGLRCERGLRPLARLCVDVAGSMPPRDHPLQLCADTLSADVVWREAHEAPQRPAPAARGGASSKAAPHSSHATVMRRERFSFDDVLVGPGARDHLSSYARHRARRALASGRGLVFLCLACGDSPRQALEPPLALVLGEAGGRGLGSVVVDEIFSFLSPSSASAAPGSSSSEGGGGGTGPRADFVAAKLAREASSGHVSLSAVLLSEGVFSDPFAPAPAPAPGPAAGAGARPNPPPRLARAKANGPAYLAHATAVQIKGVADYERLIGVLLGRRAAARELLLPQHQQEEGRWDGPASASSPRGGLDAWLLGRGGASLFLTVSVAGAGLRSLRGNAQFSFVCPCGEGWDRPGEPPSPSPLSFHASLTFSPFPYPFSSQKRVFGRTQGLICVFSPRPCLAPLDGCLRPCCAPLPWHRCCWIQTQPGPIPTQPSSWG